MDVLILVIFFFSTLRYDHISLIFSDVLSIFIYDCKCIVMYVDVGICSLIWRHLVDP